MNPGEVITSNPDYTSGGYAPEPSPIKKNLPLVIAGGVLVLILLIVAILFLSGSGRVGGKNGKPSIDKEKYEAFKNYVFYGDEKNPDNLTISKSENMYIVKLFRGTSFLNYYTNYLQSIEQQDFAKKIVELYNNLEIDTEKYPDFVEYSEAVRLLSIYIDPINYYKGKIKDLKTKNDENKVLSSIESDFVIDKKFVEWNIFATNLKVYHENAASLYAFFLKQGCAKDGQYNTECIDSKSSDVLRDFNMTQTGLQKSTANAYSDATKKMVADRLFAMIKDLGGEEE